MRNAILTSVGLCLALLGGVLFISPIPFGVAVLAVGVAMLIEGSTTCCAWIARRRALHGTIHRALSFLESTAPHHVADLLRKTHPTG